MTLSRPFTILVTRPSHQAGRLAALIGQKRWRAVLFPTLEIVPNLQSDSFHCLFDRLEKFDQSIFISANAVNFAVSANNGKIDTFSNHRIAAVGRATADALVALGLKVCVPDTGNDSESLLAMSEFENVSGQSILIIRGEGGRETLADTLRERGAKVEYLEVYRRIKPA
ncbi:MAG: uroporphyrinogen-III synthase, partial [Gammaproteobacteria bacterium]